MLLRELLGTDLYSVMLASDVWCFMARYELSARLDFIHYPSRQMGY